MGGSGVALVRHALTYRREPAPKKDLKENQFKQAGILVFSLN